MEFNLDGYEGDNIVENVPTCRYLGRPLDQTYDNWPAVRQNIMRARSVWGEARDTTSTGGGRKKHLSESFYRAVEQAILLYGLETWVLLELMKKRIEGNHT